MTARRQEAGRFGSLVLVLSAFLFLFGCATYTEKMEDGLEAFREGRMGDALERFEASRSKTRDVQLVDLEAGMAGLALGRTDEAIGFFQGAIDRMDGLTGGSAARDAASYVLDDTVTDYVGAPFEQICARLFLGMAYLLKPHPFEDVSAACRDMDEKMEQIEAYYERAYRFDGKGEAVKFSFQIPPLAKYFAALAAEERGELDSAAIYMRQAMEGAPGSSFFRREAERMSRGDGRNMVFIFAALGMVPRKIETESKELTAVLRGAKALYAAAKPDKNPSAVDRALFTAPVRIPGYPPRRPFWHGGFLVKQDGGGKVVTTRKAADFDRYAREEYKTLLPGILIRAAVRRAVKETAGQLVGRAVAKDKKISKMLGDFISSVAASVETVDTRSWCTLPREMHAASLKLRKGVQAVTLTPRAANGSRLGPDITVRIDRTNEDPAFVLIVQPGPKVRPIVLVDAGHRVAGTPRAGVVVP